MTTSSNGWSASPTLARRDLIINGVAFVGGIRDDDDVETVMRYFWTEFDRRVERLVNPGCWGFSYRDNKNNPTQLSNHASATATDGNAPQHPNEVAVADTFTPAEIAEVHKILNEVDHVLRWGGDYKATSTNPAGYDAMHAEINVDAATLHATAERLRGDTDMPFTDWPKTDQDALVSAVSKAVVSALLAADVDPDTPKLSVARAMRQAANAPNVIRTEFNKAAEGQRRVGK